MGEFNLPPNVVFSEELRSENLTVEELVQGIQSGEIVGTSMSFTHLLVKIGLCATTSEVRRLIKGNAVSIGKNKVKVSLDDKVIFIRRI